MPLAPVWAALFFSMLFILGITTSFGYTQVTREDALKAERERERERELRLF